MSVAFPASWAYRPVFVPRHPTPFSVPRYVVRIDIEDHGRAGTHGWQVRYRTPGSRFFSDSKFDTALRLGTPADSLQAAKLYLFSIWTGDHLPQLPAERAGKKHPTGLTGVRVVWRERRGSLCCHVRVDNLAGKPIANIYVGTGNTATHDRLEATISHARRIRIAYLGEIDAIDRLPPPPAS